MSRRQKGKAESFLSLFYFFLPSRRSLSRVQEILISIRPRLSVWSHPHKWGTLSVQRLCTFISHAEKIGKKKKFNLIIWKFIFFPRARKKKMAREIQRHFLFWYLHISCPDGWHRRGVSRNGRRMSGCCTCTVWIYVSSGNPEKNKIANWNIHRIIPTILFKIYKGNLVRQYLFFFPPSSSILAALKTKICRFKRKKEEDDTSTCLPLKTHKRKEGKKNRGKSHNKQSAHLFLPFSFMSGSFS